LFRDLHKNIALTGFMAVGKSAVGRRLARRLKWPFVDLDRVIEDKEGMRVQDIFRRKGESHFRKVEKEILKEILSQDEQVIATGGGAILDEESLSLLRDRSLLICLTASPQNLLRRSGLKPTRPLLAGPDKIKRIESLMAEREAAYGQAHISIDTGSVPVNKVVEKIIEKLNFQQGDNKDSGSKIQTSETGGTGNSKC
jgi:shikimate kinase